MNASSRLWALLVIGGGAAGVPGGLLAQVSGLPVRNAGIGTGISFAGDLGLPNGDAGKGVAFGATGTIGAGPIGFSGSVAHWDPKGAARAINSVGGTGNLKIFGGPLVPLSVTLQAGVGYYSHTTTTLQGTSITQKNW